MTNVSEKKITGTARVVCIVVTILMFVGAIGMMVTSAVVEGAMQDYAEPATNWFDSSKETEEKSFLEFTLMSEEFATYTVNENQRFYFVLEETEEAMYPYIVCMNVEDLSKYEDILKYTFDNTGEVAYPEPGYIEGYSVLIEESLKSLAIEGFNSFWGETVLTEENFEEYIGNYYLDATILTVVNNPLSEFLNICSYILLALGVILLCLLFQKKPVQNISQTTELVKENQTMEATDDTSYFNSVVQEEPVVKENTVAGIIGAFGGAMIGCIIWTVIFHFGYMASIVGLLTGWLAMAGYEFLGKKRGTFGTIISLVFAVLAIVLGNYIGYAWAITDSLNETTAGRGEFLEILRLMPQLLTEFELWGDFAKDLVVGLVLVLISVISTIMRGIRK